MSEQDVATGTPAGVRWTWLLEEGVNSANWSFALRESRRHRERAAGRSSVVFFGSCANGAWETERSGGIPPGWWNRP